MYKILFFAIISTLSLLIHLKSYGASSAPTDPMEESPSSAVHPLKLVQYRSIPFEKIPHLMPNSDAPGTYFFQFPKDTNPKEETFIKLTAKFQSFRDHTKLFLDPNIMGFTSKEDDLLPLHTAFFILNQGLAKILESLPSSADSENEHNQNLPASFQNDYALAWVVVQVSETNGHLSKILDLIKSPDHRIFENPQYDSLILTLLMAYNGLEKLHQKIENKIYTDFLNNRKESFKVLAKPANTPSTEKKEEIRSVIATMVESGKLPPHIVQTINQYPILKELTDELEKFINSVPVLERPHRFALPQPQEDIKDEAERMMSLLERTWAEHAYLSEASAQLLRSIDLLKLHPKPIEIIQKMGSIDRLITKFSAHLAQTKQVQINPNPSLSSQSAHPESQDQSSSPDQARKDSVRNTPSPTQEQAPLDSSSEVSSGTHIAEPSSAEPQQKEVASEPEPEQDPEPKSEPDFKTTQAQVPTIDASPESEIDPVQPHKQDKITEL